MSAKTFDFV